jgi:urease accessory protein UreF
MDLPPELLLAANALIRRHGAAAEEYAARQLWDARQKEDEKSADGWRSMLEALKRVREIREETKHGS